MNLMLIGLGVFFASMIASRAIMSKAFNKLDDSEKLKLLGEFSGGNTYSMIFGLGLVLLYFAALQYFRVYLFQVTAIYFVIFAVYLGFRYTRNLGKLEKVGVPADYMKTYHTAQAIGIVGLISFFGAVFWTVS